MSGENDRVGVSADGAWTADVDEEEGVVVNWFASEGARVDVEDTLCEVQVEKVSIDILAPAAGTLTEIVRGENDEFTIGDTLAWIDTG